MTFDCPNCHQSLIAEPSHVGQVVPCPVCGKKLKVPKPSGGPAAPAAGQKTATATPSAGKPGAPSQPAQNAAAAAGDKPTRQGWKETDPSNPNMLHSLALGVGGVVVWYLILLPFRAPESVSHGSYTLMNFVASLFYGHFLVSVLNTLFFFWSMAIIYLKIGMLKRQKTALMLDILPAGFGTEITAANTGLFIDNLYALPVKLRDSMMVNRIRKALEYFEVRQSSGDVREMMASQSDIDAARITGSFTLLRAFLWAIPLLGFIGTVVGLSQAIGGMNFSNVSDVSKVVESINKVTSGLGTAFDATLLGLVLAMTLNFPLNWLVKQEDDNLSNIDAFCNEILLPRLIDTKEEVIVSDGAPKNETVTDTAGFVESLREIQSGFLSAVEILSLQAKESAASQLLQLKEAQAGFLSSLKEIASQMDSRAAEIGGITTGFCKTLTEEFITKTEEMRTGVKDAAAQAAGKAVEDSLGKVSERAAAIEAAFKEFNRSLEEMSRKQSEKTVAKAGESMDKAGEYLGRLEKGITSLNDLLKDLGGKQITVNVTKKRGWFGRD
jgi:biopolymer transport protein ExbB/TolQ/ribosomal protein S27E